MNQNNKPMELSNQPITEDFIETFPTKEDCTGAMARMISKFSLPEGVNENDPKVQQIISWCKENYPS